MNRRSFVKAGVLLGISPTILQAVEKKTDKRCVYIYLGGGISHIEFLNPIPESQVEFRSVTGSVKTNSGYDIGGSFTNLAQCSELFTTVRSLSHLDANHNSAAHWVQTGHKAFEILDNGAAKEPSYGSIVTTKYGANEKSGMPNYVKVSKIPHDGPAWLGSKHMGYDNDTEATKNLALENRDRFMMKTKMLSEVNKQSFKLGNTAKMFKDWEDTRNTAIEIITGDVASAFKIDLEDEQTKLKYKIASSAFGKSLLTARRLIENGCRFVTTENSGWDMHSDILNGFNTKGPELDEMLSVFLKDLNDRGLLANTLVVVCSEFGRTNKLNSSGPIGRDHHPACNSLILAGSNYGGTLIGKTDSKASIVSDNPFSPSDLAWTILNHFDISKDLTIVDSQKRPRHIIDKEAKLIL
jgi:hypothetical protein